METVTVGSNGSHVAFVALGSNLGDKKENCLQGMEMLFGGDHTRLIERSRFYRTAPMDYKKQDWFVNAVVKVATRLDPFLLLKELLAIETALGRCRRNTARFGPRTLDMDLILYGTERIESDTLVVPHPRMHRRRFVLRPICDIEPELPHPVLGKTMRQFLATPQVAVQELEVLGDD